MINRVIAHQKLKTADPTLPSLYISNSPSPMLVASDWLEAAQPCKQTTGDRREEKVKSVSISMLLPDTFRDKDA